jgi:hypothetical protein
MTTTTEQSKINKELRAQIKGINRRLGYVEKQLEDIREQMRSWVIE